MYKNWFTELFMTHQIVIEIFGILKYYDMFSLRGSFNWSWDFVVLLFVPWIETLYLFMRIDSGNWTLGTSEYWNDVDMNRIFTTPERDPYDYALSVQSADGTDCNGNKGEGLYCYCPS